MRPPTESPRVLCSPAEAPLLRAAIAQAGGPPCVLLHPEDGADFDAAFVSRDITGRSTKFEILPDTRVYYDALLRAPGLRWAHIHSSGADRDIYLQLMARGVTLTTSQGATDAVVAQTALAGILALARRLPYLARAQADHAWRPLLEAELPRDLAGQHAVIVGWGGIGQRIGQWLISLGLTLDVVRHSDARAPEARRSAAYRDLPALLPDADWLVLACPLTDATRGLAGAAALDALPAHACVVNVARGHVIDENALAQRLAAKRLAGAFLDVFQHEPLPAGSPFWDLENVIVTPHSAAFSDGNAARVRALFARNLARYAAGEPLLNVARTQGFRGGGRPAMPPSL